MDGGRMRIGALDEQHGLTHGVLHMGYAETGT